VPPDWARPWPVPGNGTLRGALARLQRKRRNTDRILPSTRRRGSPSLRMDRSHQRLAGSVRKSVSRIHELAGVVENLETTSEEKVDVLLVTGDVFDSGAPSSDAERHVFTFFRNVSP
jgi:hypothetical protein